MDNPLTLSFLTQKVWLDSIEFEKHFTILCYVVKPHNPMINAGALVLSSLIKPEKSITEKTNFVSCNPSSNLYNINLCSNSSIMPVVISAVILCNNISLSSR